MVHSSKLLPILFLCLSRRDSRLTLSQPLDSRLTVWHHSNVEILFCCVPTSPAIGATEMRTVVFDCFSDVSEFRTAQTECINISTYEHTSQQLRMAGSKKCHFSETHFRVLKRWKFSSTKCQVPATVAQDCCAGSIWVKISAINISYIIYHTSYFIYHIYIYIYINKYPSIFPIFPWELYRTIRMIRMCLVSETFGYFIAWAIIECDCCDWTAGSAEPNIFGRSEDSWNKWERPLYLNWNDSDLAAPDLDEMRWCLYENSSGMLTGSSCMKILRDLLYRL